MKKLLMLLLLVPSLVSASTFTYDFEGSHSNYPADSPLCAWVGQVSNGGITATFGSTFSLSHSLASSSTKTCNIRWWDGLAPGRFTCPSGEWAAQYSWDCGDGGDIDSRSIVFSTPIKFFSCDLAGVSDGNSWDCEPWVSSVDDGATWNTHVHGGTLGSNIGSFTTTAKLEMWTSGCTGNSSCIKKTVHPNVMQSWSGCGPEYPDQSSPGGDFNWSNTTTPICVWQHVEMYSATGCTRIYVRDFGDWSTPLYFDNIQASTAECMSPPCQFERAEQARDEEPATFSPDVTVPPDATMLQANTRTGEMRRISRKDGRLYVSPATKTTWGRVKQIYR